MVHFLLCYHISDHTLARCQQRGIGEDDLFAVFYFGMVERTHGCLRYILTDRSLANTPLAKDAHRLRGLTLVVNPVSNEVVTVKHQYDIAGRPGILRKSQLLERAKKRDRDVAA